MSDIPTELRYASTHEWVKVEENIATVGITQHAQELLGDLVFVELPEIDDEFNREQEVGVVESVKAASDFYAPIDGVIVEVNENLADNPAIVNEDPYGDGWLVKIRLNDENQIAELLDSEQYAQSIED